MESVMLKLLGVLGSAGKAGTAARWMACFTLLLAGAALAQDFPNKPLRIVIHVAPGSGTDLMTRAVGAAMARSLGQPAVIENRPGASGLIAWEYVARQLPADGHSMVSGGSSHATASIFVKELRSDPMKDMVSVSLFAEGSQVLVAAANAPFNSFTEMLGYAKANPGRVTFGSSGFAGPATLNTLSIRQRYGLDVTDVPYTGNSPARVALLSGTIQLMWYTEGEFVVDSSEKRIKGMLISATHRPAHMADVPTAMEIGQPIAGFYYGLSVPVATPRPAIDRLYAAIASALKQPEVSGLAARYYLKLHGLDPDASKTRLLELATTYADIADKAGIKPR